MAVTINANYIAEVATSTLAAAQADGLILQYNASGVLAPATTRVDAILMSEIVTASEYINRYNLYQDVDFGPYTQIGEPVSVAKGFRGATAIGLLVTAAADIAAGTELELNNGVLRPYTSGTKVAVAIDPIKTGATVTGQVHLY